MSRAETGEALAPTLDQALANADLSATRRDDRGHLSRVIALRAAACSSWRRGEGGHLARTDEREAAPLICGMPLAKLRSDTLAQRVIVYLRAPMPVNFMLA